MHCPVCKDVCEAQRKRKATENASFDHDEKRKKRMVSLSFRKAAGR